jgi:DNA-binding transcriptional ArsR family regulator
MDADSLSRAFAALADPTRRDLVSRLTLGDATVGELAAPYDMSLQAVSKHLTVLESAGLVTRRRDAQRRPVHLEAEVLGELTDWIDHHRTAAEARLSRLDEVLQQLEDPAPSGTPRSTDSPEGTT